MSNPTTTPSAMAPATLKRLKPKSFDGDKNKFTEWFQHIEMYWAFNDVADNKKKILVTSQFMDKGPAAAWAGAWCTKELSRSQNDPSRFVWHNFVTTLWDTYALVNVTGDAQA